MQMSRRTRRPLQLVQRSLCLAARLVDIARRAVGAHPDQFLNRPPIFCQIGATCRGFVGPSSCQVALVEHRLV